MKRILDKCVKRLIYVELPNGYHVKVTRKELIKVLKRMQEANEDLNTIQVSQYETSHVFLTLK